MNSWEKEILDAWDMFEEQDPDISTERLFAMVSDYTGREVDEITDTLFKYRCNEKKD